MNWLSVLTSSGVVLILVACAAWLARKLIAVRLTSAVRFEFDEKLERLRAEIRTGEAHLDSVRSTALAAVANSQAGLNDRRLRAIEELWKATMTLRAGMPVVKIIGGIRLGAVGKPEPSVQKLVTLFEPLQKGFLEQKRNTHAAQDARPFLSPMSWALYTAYSSIVLQAAVQFNSIKNGDDPMQFVDTARTLEVVKTALPEFGQLIDQHREAAYPELLPEIEDRLLSELRATAEGRESDKQGVERAKKIAHLAAMIDTEGRP